MSTRTAASITWTVGAASATDAVSAKAVSVTMASWNGVPSTLPVARPLNW
jgi:hypothetical protein